MTEEVLTIDDFYKILSHPARRTTIKLLHERIEMTYSELLREVGMDEGQFNFHLRMVKKLTESTRDGKYLLSHRGRVAYDLALSIEKEFREAGSFLQQPLVTKEILGRRVAAFLVDALIFFMFSGVWLDTFLWTTLAEFAEHLLEVATLHPWLFHFEHLPHIGELAFRVVGTYSHIFFAIFITLTLLDSYKGQTPGRYLLGIRVVTVSNRRLDLVESGIRSIGKVFLLPLDLLVGLVFFSKRGYIRFSDYYTQSKIEKVKVELRSTT